MSVSGKTLLIRADADCRMGTGHVMRCLALAQAWQEAGGQAELFCATVTPAVQSRLQREGVPVTLLGVPPGSAADAAATIESARRIGAAWVVVDGYQFGGDYQYALHAAGCRLLVIDDYGHAEWYWADVVLNPNLHADESFYRNRQRSTALLLGPRYALLRREFWRWRGWKRTIPAKAQRLLVTLGGADPDNATLKVMEAIGGLDVEGLEATVLVGGSNPHRAALEDAAGRWPTPMRLEVDTAEMPRWMAWADAAITAAGTTLWELALLAVPSNTLILAENQEPAACLLAQRGIFPTLGWAATASVDAIRDQFGELLGSRVLRRRHSQEAARLVDGNGVFRIVESLEQA